MKQLSMMKQVRSIDFSGDHRPSATASRADAAMLCVAIALVSAMGYQWHQTRLRMINLEAVLDAIGTKQAVKPTTHDTTVTLPPAQATALNQAIDKLNLPWPALFRALNAGVPREVAVLVISPDTARREARITAETDKVDNMIRCLQSLKKRPEFESVRLVHNQIDEKDAMHPLRFELQLSWRPMERSGP